MTEGLAEADSWATDGHKWLNVPYDGGIVLVRSAADLRAAMSANAAYLAEGVEGDREPSHYTPESSRRARGVEKWAALLNLGRDGIADLVERTCRHARAFARGLEGHGFEILNDVVLNQVLVSFGSPEATRAVIRHLQTGGSAGVEGLCGRGVQPCASASQIGRPPKPMSRLASRQWFRLQGNRAWIRRRKTSMAHATSKSAAEYRLRVKSDYFGIVPTEIHLGAPQDLRRIQTRGSPGYLTVRN